MRNIALIGFMGTGKTTVGHVLAARLGMTFLDMDDVIVERESRPINAIFATDGEDYFRSVERALVTELAAREDLVIGTGGGVVLNADNVADLERTGLVVCLSATPDVILDRVMHDTTRPLLAGDNKMANIRRILNERQERYDAIPHQVDTTTLSITEVVDRIASLYQDRYPLDNYA